MGRDKKNEARVEQFAKLRRSVIEAAAWKALSPVAQALYPWLLLEWKGAAFNNNGLISFSVRQAAAAMGIDKKTAGRAFQDLQAKGFICVTRPAELGVEGKAACPQYEITEIGLTNGERRGPRNLFKSWSPKDDFPVQKTPPRNPSGVNGKNKTLSPKRGRCVPKKGTET